MHLLALLVKLPLCEVVVDVQGTLEHSLTELAQVHHNLRVVHSPKIAHQAYSPGQARNRAIACAKGEYLFLMDADLQCAPPLLHALVARSQRLATRGPQAFEMFPCLYLTEQETKRGDIVFEDYVAAYLSGRIDRIENIALASSCLLVQRAWFHTLGGFDADFIGHGGEDLALIHQLCLHYPMMDLPDDYTDNIKAKHPADYQGCRRYYALYALQHLFNGDFLLHRWHPRPLTHAYHQRRASNDSLLVEKLCQQRPRALIAGGSENTALQQRCGVSRQLSADINLQFVPWLTGLQEAFGYSVTEFPGLFALHPSVVIKRPWWRKIRKLYVNPARFFKDSRLYNTFF